MRRSDKPRLTNEQLEVILNSTHDGMVAVNASGVITVFNAAAGRLMGVDPEDMVGQVAEEVIPNTRLHIVLKTGEAELNQKQVLEDVTIICNRMPVRDSNGTMIGTVSVFRDITDIISLAEEITNLKHIQGLLEAIINSTEDAISVVDENGLGILINPAYTRLTGFVEDDVIGKPATIDIAEGESVHMKVLRTGLPIRGAKLRVGPGRREVMVHAAPIFVDEELRGSVAAIHDLTDIRRLTEELDSARRLLRTLQAKYTFDDIIAVSKGMALAVEQAKRVSSTPATVLLRGESGTGKELFAHAIHNASLRRQKQFVRVNCTAISSTLFEAELFGYEDGAFTGAKRGGKRGLFEEAAGGAIFLDEIGELPLSLQAKLLRILHEKEIVRVGGTRAIPVDVRIIAATNSDLEKAVKEGRLREDLYYRLNVVPIFIPPLRERLEDLPFLCQALIRRFNQAYGRNVTRISGDAIEALCAYDWPGNVRELENVLSRAMINMYYTDVEILPQHLPALDRLGSRPAPTQRLQGSQEKDAVRKLEETVKDAEVKAIQSALEAASGNKRRASEILGISIRSLYYKINRYNIIC
ncbi:MAG: sigma-54-dependent transcriptional regulator [Firmicutes bacterium]|mgnify:CR=1 FL=1|jgi:PAS domain S-box-containing protein|nr:sigma-54-dependent transcriptional regulator [Bacillota bacterium]